MATYAIGDVHGCLNELKNLLATIHFDKARDTLWFTGDLVNRGPQSLETLRFVKNLGKNHKTVLGNHDIFLLHLYFCDKSIHNNRSLQAVVDAPDCKELIDWLCTKPLMHYDSMLHIALTHAGISPLWTVKQALALSDEIHHQLMSDQRQELLRNTFGNFPNLWRENLTGWERSRCIINYFTRMRFCTVEGRLNLTDKSNVTPKGFIPWFNTPSRLAKECTILFGHWAALNGITPHENVFSLDTGCVWGNHLTALRLEDKRIFQVPGLNQ